MPGFAVFSEVFAAVGQGFLGNDIQTVGREGFEKNAVAQLPILRVACGFAVRPMCINECCLPTIQAVVWVMEIAINLVEAARGVLIEPVPIFGLVTFFDQVMGAPDSDHIITSPGDAMRPAELLEKLLHA